MNKHRSGKSSVYHFHSYTKGLKINFVVAGFLIMMLVLATNNTSSRYAATAVIFDISDSGSNDEGFTEPWFRLVSNSSAPGSSINPSISNPMDPVVQDVLSKFNLTSINRADGDDRVLIPDYQFTQTNNSGDSDFRVFHYIWRDSPQHYDLEAIVGVKPWGDQYHVEIGKLSNRAIKVDIGDMQGGIIPGTNATAEVSMGFVEFMVPR